MATSATPCTLSFAKTGPARLMDVRARLRARDAGDCYGARSPHRPAPALPTRSRRTQNVRQNDKSSRRGLVVLRLRCPPDVAVMQATDFGNREDRAERWGSIGRPSGASFSSER
jgi:hypothetical protein